MIQKAKNHYVEKGHTDFLLMIIEIYITRNY